jgi:hypothetical protein
VRRTKKAAKSKSLPRSAPRKRRPLAASVPNKPTETTKTHPLAIGDRVAHPQFGNGTITHIEDHKLTINFAALGSKQIIDSYVKQKQ